ncbi:MAG: hypothetical protein KA377_03665 [Chromatiaceae bacterium]|nr:hypothetical protein [Chromatiaceae bacterium]MBP9605228.1 hypothetical protein [Chromatiaceae bacterium]
MARALRIRQWAKNLLLFLPLLVAHQLSDGAQLLATGLAFLSFGLTASASIWVIALLVVGGRDFDTEVLATVICRAVTLWFAVVLGIGAMFLLGRR